jgi:hypothetical protein
MAHGDFVGDSGAEETPGALSADIMPGAAQFL